MSKNSFLSILNKVRIPNPNKSVFDLSYSKTGTMRFGEMVPTYVETVVPGDVFQISQSAFVRLEPLSAPMMGNIKVDTFFFYVPFRIIWDDFEKFITGGRLGLDEPNLPFFNYNLSERANAKNDYRLLLQLKQAFVNSSDKVVIPSSSALPWRAYWKIVDEYARDQNLMESYFEPDTGTPKIKTDSNDITVTLGADVSNGLYRPFIGAWSKDIFTSALPFPQRGSAVSVPLMSDVSMYSEEATSAGGLTDTSNIVARSENGQVTTLIAEQFVGLGDLAGVLRSGVLSSFTIEDLREANVVQRWLELSAIGGNRYKEAMMAHYGVTLPDYRIQRPEYLGGMSTNVMISQVTQNSQTTENSVLGDYAGHGMAAGTMTRFTKFCPEHGIIMGISVIRPTAVYSQGINRNLLKKDKFEFYFPEFQNLGEQDIKLGELYALGSNESNNSLFGYGPRFYEYKMRHDEVFGDFDYGGLEYWVPQRKFSSAPALNMDFISVDPAKESSLNNIFAVTDSAVDPFRVLFHNNVKAIRPMNKWSNFSLM